ncbi:hypothetical protein, partial [Kocuria sp. CPCC 205263]|uniref:hypothetical protein n=1 Tax=Kocuria sp. CPCC 205263 TaxID=3073555 RepID=UPI0034D770DB
MRLFTVGGVLTVIYFVVLGVWINGAGLTHVSSWNELGDFFAGVFSPVAFLWLILGFIQQHKELVNNTAQLNLQAQELKKSVEQAAIMASLTSEQLQFEREKVTEEAIKLKASIMPVIEIERFNWGTMTGKVADQVFSIKNKGKPAKNIVVTSDGYDFKGMNKSFLPEGDSITKLYRIDMNTAPENLNIKIVFSDALGNTYENTFSYKKVDNQFELISS